MQCPICLAQARDANPPEPSDYHYRGLVVDCPGCGLYRVTERAAAPLTALKLEERFAALKKARSLTRSRLAPTITTGCLPDK